MQDGRPIVSKTDLKGRITYVNPYFTEVSGFTESELLGAPHNIVRHPDMPEEAFADLWRAIKDGRLWSAPVKNRRKNGDYYWVIANVTPIIKGGEVIGYMSVRTKPTRAQIREAEAAYAEINKSHGSRLAVINGRICRTGWTSLFTQKMRLSLKARLAWSSALQLAAMGGLCAVVGLSGSSTIGPWVMAGSIMSCLITMQLWLHIHRSVALPLGQVATMAQMLAAGSLINDMTVDQEGDIGRVQQSLQQLNVNLIAAIGDIKRNVDAINIATSDIAAGNMDLSGRTELQASSLEETASSMEEFASNISQTATNAGDADRLVAEASDIALRGGEAVANVGQTMNDISASARRVADIISVIDGIAFQTNILALNAAVEAARAGESGRGFAVVAAEVRNLAQRSAAAAKEIKTLIDASVESVDAGTDLVAVARQTMHEVVAAVAKVTTIVSDIASASKEQAIGVQQVNQAVSQMDQVTQQNAALVEQAAAASASLHDQAMRLSHAVAVFDLHPMQTERGDQGADK